MTMRDIPGAERNVFLATFTREHRSTPVTVAKSDVRDGLRIAERATPLLNLTHDRAAHRISITEKSRRPERSRTRLSNRRVSPSRSPARPTRIRRSRFT